LEHDEEDGADDRSVGRILVSIAGVRTVEPLVELAVLMKQPRVRERLFALHVVDEAHSEGAQSSGRKLMEAAVRTAAASDHVLEPVVRHDINVSSGLIYSIREYRITDVVLGITRDEGDPSTLFGTLTDTVLQRTNRAVYIYSPLQPLGTIKRIVVAVPPKAEFELGFVRWFDRLRAIAKQTGAAINFHATPSTLERLRALCERGSSPLEALFEEMEDWEDFLIVGRGLRADDLLVVVSARRASLSYDPLFERLPRLLYRYFRDNGHLVVLPEQMGDEYHRKADLNPSMSEALEEGVKQLDSAGRFVKKVFTRN
jgi:hypothetical protein